ncbi:MAG: hypothetical protein MSG64_17265 [Pyrinomonadaceae bacterium MAG19_C2-C3]|nr:hypothetical protein [Pyrinomonadaceae bacterium MAG19_C2-C3]
MTEEERDEKRQRQMDFILEHQAQFSVDIQQLKETQAEQQQAHNALQREVQQAHTDLLRALETYARNSDERHARNEAAIFALTQQQDRTTNTVRLLATSVDRVSEAVATLLDRDARRNGEN